ncbi:unnamed protein product [Anisakis simplex]|uniref:Uncharacterized protein n=1 Tax=Anisakis simplex TaxID=6269 RepID=A0A0M3J132_ANISI|nr:unnamed protein product [Anisakis simplex]
MVSYKPDRCTPWNQQNSLLSPADRRRKAAAPPEGMSDATLKSRQTAISSDQPSKQSSQTLYYPDSSTSEAKQWDIFRLLPPPPDSAGRGISIHSCYFQ